MGDVKLTYCEVINVKKETARYFNNRPASVQETWLSEQFYKCYCLYEWTFVKRFFGFSVSFFFFAFIRMKKGNENERSSKSNSSSYHLLLLLSFHHWRESFTRQKIEKKFLFRLLPVASNLLGKGKKIKKLKKFHLISFNKT